ncbi:MAG: DUF4012 domain-containing protein [Marmoricola sp.]
MTFSLARLLTRRRIIAAVGALVLIAAIVFVIEAVLAALAMSAARADGDAVAARLSAGDLVGASAASAKLEKDAQRARSLTDDPLWWVGDHVPLLGADVSAVQDSATALDAIAHSSLPVLLTLADAVENGSLRPRAGRVSPEAIARFAPSVRQAANALDGPALQVQNIDTSSLLPPLNSLMSQVQSRINQAKVAIDAAANAFEVLPTVLGGHGPRTYLLLVQNPAEIRASGGLPGTWALIHANDGHLRMTQTKFVGQIAQGISGFNSVPVPLTTDEAELFGSQFGTTPNDITETPDFPRAAQIATALERRLGVNVSAVFSVDPMALSYVLAGTGTVTLQPGVQLTAGNAVPFLLNYLYLHTDFPTQNATFALAAHRTFDALVAGQGNQVNAIRGLVQAVLRHRVFAWSADPALAKVVDAESLSGAFPQNTGQTPQVGIYLNDGVAGKPEYYLRQSSVVNATGCSGGVQQLRLQTSLQSLMPPNAVTLPIWVVGTGEFAPKGHILMQGYIAGPWHGTIDSVTVDGQPITVTANQLDGRQIALLPVDLTPGQLMTVTATMHTGPGQTGPGQLTWTPGMGLDPDPATFGSGC